MLDQATVYDSHGGWGRAPAGSHAERVERTLALVPPDVEAVLDVGCGDGAVSNHLVDRGVRVVGVDISRSALEHFRGSGSVASLEALPFRDRAFDLVLCSEVLEHLPEGLYDTALRELQRVAARYLLVTVPNEEYLPRQYVLCSACGHVYHRDHHMRSFDRATVEALFADFAPATTDLIGTRRSNAAIVGLRHALLRVYRKRGHLCPQCGERAPFVARLGPVRKLLKHGIRLLAKCLPRRRRAHWIAVLFRRA
ncbi:class I SAM-dependent methyltransferase [bacterium]|nr:class I SAM-dependent methyltransferase [bacterium]